MEISSPKLLIEINMNEFIFLILESDKNESFKIIDKYSLPIQGINNKKIQSLMSLKSAILYKELNSKIL